MGAEAIWVPLVLGAVQAGASYVNNRQQIKRQDRIALESLRANKDRQRKADEVTQKLIADTAASTDKDERKSVMDGFMQQLQKARGDAQSGLRPVGGASDAFARDAEAAALGIDQSGSDYASLASRLESPFLQRRSENRIAADAATNIGLVGRDQQGADRVTDLRQRAVRGNPWLEALSAVAGGAASSYRGGGGGSAAGAAAFTPSANAMLDPALGSTWGGANSLVWGNYGGLR